MRIKWKYFFLLFIVAGCKNNADQAAEKDSSLYPEPLTIPLNLSGGYAVNSLTSDSIKPVINLYGDTVKTGISFPFIGSIDERKKSSLEIIKPTAITKRIITDNYHPLPDNISSIPIDTAKLKRTKLGEGDQSFVLHNSTGIVPTGVPIQITGKIVPLKEPMPTRALPMRSKDNATVNVQYLDVEQGLGYSYVYGLLEDKRGNIWIGMDGTGLSKYDGVNFTTYTTKEGLSGNSIREIFEDHNGNIWIGTENGITILDGINCIRFTEKEGLPVKLVYSIMEDKKGNIWIGTENRGVTKFEINKLAGGTGKFIHYTVKEGLPDMTVSSCIEDDKGFMWFATSNGLARFNGQDFLKIESGLGSNKISKLLDDKNGNLWIGTADGIVRYDGKSVIHFSNTEGLSDNIVISLLKDKKGNIWIGTLSGGINKFDGKGFTHYALQQGLSGNKVTKIIEDRQGYIWLGFEGGGVNKLSISGFTYKIDKAFFDNSRVRPIMNDARGNLWFGTEAGNIYKYSGKELGERYDFNYPPNFFGYRSMLSGKDGNLWFGATGGVGLIKYDGKKFMHYMFGDEYGAGIIMSIVEDKNDAIWLGTYNGGVKKIDKENYTAKKSVLEEFTVKEGLSSNSVLTVFEDKASNLWICTEGGGLSKYDGTNLINYTEKEGLFCKSVTSLAEDKDGNLWLGTIGAGVCRFDGKEFNYYTTLQGLSHNNVWSVFEDSIGHIWAGTDKGLTLFIPQQDSDLNSKKDYAIYNFDEQDGIKAIDFNLRSVCIDKNDRIWWGTGVGVPTLDMNIPVKSYIPRSLNLSFIEINNRFYDFRNLQDSTKNKISFSEVKPFCNYPEKLSLSYDQNHISFHFSSIDWSAPDKIKYSYRLIGLDDKWSNPSSETIADFRNLPHGKYELQVKAIGQSQIWSGPITYNFIIRPPWWLTWWFKLMIVTAILTIIFIIVQFIYNYQLRKQKEVFEKQLAVQMERQRISSEMHDDVGAGLSGVRLMTEMAKAKSKDPQSISEIEKIYNSIGDVSARMKEVIWSLNTENDSLNSLITYLQKQTRQMMEHYPATFSFNISDTIPDVKINGEARRQIYLSLKEALHNVIKHSGADKVELNIACDDKLNISITDNGKGMNPEENYSGGNGLKNMRRRMKELNGEFFIKNGKGLTLIFKIPLNQEV